MPHICQVRSSATRTVIALAAAGMLTLSLGAATSSAQAPRVTTAPTIQSSSFGHYAIGTPVYGNAGTSSAGSYLRYRWEVAPPGGEWRGALGGTPYGYFVTATRPNQTAVSDDVPAGMALYRVRLAAYAERPARGKIRYAKSSVRYSRSITILDVPQLSVRVLPAPQAWPVAITGTNVLPPSSYTVLGVGEGSEQARSYQEAWNQTILPLPTSSGQIRDGWARMSLIVSSLLVAQMSASDAQEIKNVYSYFKAVAKPNTNSTLVSNYVRYECVRRVTLQILQWLVNDRQTLAVGDWILSSTGGSAAGNAVTAAGRRTWENMLTYLGKEKFFKTWLAQSSVNKAINLAVNPSGPLREFLQAGASNAVRGTLKSTFPVAMLRCQMLSTPASQWAKPMFSQ